MLLNRKEHLNKTGIYSIVNKINNKQYIGKAKCIYSRATQHKTNLVKKSKDENRYLINAFHKYGEENFETIIIEELPLEDAILSERELYWIDFYETTNRDKGYNLRRDSSTKMIAHEETRLLLSEAGKNRYLNMTQIEKDIESKRLSDFWKHNPNKLLEMRKNVSAHHRINNILQFDKEMNFIKEYEGRHDILLNYPDLYPQAILAVCNGSKNSYKGFYWRYKNIETGEILHQLNSEERKEKAYSKGKKVYLYVDNLIPVQYRSLCFACKCLNLCYPNIHKYLKNNTRYYFDNNTKYLSY